MGPWSRDTNHQISAASSVTLSTGICTINILIYYIVICICKYFIWTHNAVHCSGTTLLAFIPENPHHWLTTIHESMSHWSTFHFDQILKRGGFRDEHIVVMMYDDIAHDPSNPYPGQIFNRPGERGIGFGYEMKIGVLWSLLKFIIIYGSLFPTLSSSNRLTSSSNLLNDNSNIALVQVVQMCTADSSPTTPETPSTLRPF